MNNYRGATYEARQLRSGRWLARIGAGAVYARNAVDPKTWPTKERAELGARLEIDRRILDGEHQEPTRKRSRKAKAK